MVDAIHSASPHYEWQQVTVQNGGTAEPPSSAGGLFNAQCTAVAAGETVYVTEVEMIDGLPWARIGTDAWVGRRYTV